MNGILSDVDDGEVRTVVRWVVLTGDRLVVSLVVLLGIAATFVVAGLAEVLTVTTTTRVMWYLNGTVNGLLTLIPISVGVNQIVLSQELGSIQDYHERRMDLTAFRDRVEAHLDTSVTSPFASTFFSTLLDGVADTARSLQDDGERGQGAASGSTDGDDTMDVVQTVAGSMADEAESARAALEPGETTMLQTLVVMLGYDDSVHENKVRELLERDDVLDRDVQDRLQKIEDLFEEVDTARQYLKTLVVEQQLARLSKLLVYTGIPAVVVAALAIFGYRDVAALDLSHTALVLVAAVVVVATLVPLVILAVYVLRVATIARGTAAFGPFVPESKR